MPCVCLTNTFRFWQAYDAWLPTYRAQKRAVAQLAKQKASTQSDTWHYRRIGQTTMAIICATKFPRRLEPIETLYVPHRRKPLFDSASVSQTLTAAISSRLHTVTPVIAPASSVASSATPANIMRVQPITPEEIKPGATRADLINAESRLGSAIFGPIPVGHRREFFHDRKNIWIWHEDWQDQMQQLHQVTVRYEVRTSGVYKKVSTGKYLRLDGEELEKFRQATHAYLYLIKKYLYNTPATA